MQYKIHKYPLKLVDFHYFVDFKLVGFVYIARIRADQEIRDDDWSVSY